MIQTDYANINLNIQMQKPQESLQALQEKKLFSKTMTCHILTFWVIVQDSCNFSPKFF